MWSRVILYAIKCSLTSKYRLLLFRVMRAIFSWIPYVCGAKFFGYHQMVFQSDSAAYRPIIPPHQQRKALKKKKKKAPICKKGWFFSPRDELGARLKNQFVKTNSSFKNRQTSFLLNLVVKFIDQVGEDGRMSPSFHRNGGAFMQTERSHSKVVR